MTNSPMFIEVLDTNNNARLVNLLYVSEIMQTRGGDVWVTLNNEYELQVLNTYEDIQTKLHWVKIRR
jgi:hypothetical protein